MQTALDSTANAEDMMLLQEHQTGCVLRLWFGSPRHTYEGFTSTQHAPRDLELPFKEFKSPTDQHLFFLHITNT